MTRDFYQGHLDRVSRSFAFCMRELSSPLYEWVSLAYLLLRVLDTVEDARWTDTASQRRQFRQFEELLLSQRDDVAAWVRGFPEVNGGEQQLLPEMSLLLEDLRALPPEARLPLLNTALDMSALMQQFVGEQPGIRIASMAALDRYCYCVAGIVGRLLLDFYCAARPGFSLPARDATFFGIALQKINVLKDQAEDEREGRFLVPDRAALRASLDADVTAGMRFVLAIPPGPDGLRVFCAHALLLGLASLPHMDRGTRISRDETARLVAAVRDAAATDASLLALARSLGLKW